MLTARLVSTRDLSSNTRHFEFEIPELQHFEYTPGQFVSIVHNDVTRAYSIASPRTDTNRFALCLNLVPDGAVSPFLFSMKPGDAVQVREPLGYFTLRHPGRHVLFVATGTGIAPFRGMLLEHLPKFESRIALLFGARYAEGLLYKDELDELAAAHPDFKPIYTVTRPDESWTGKTGRVQAHLDYALGITSEDLATLDVYICGLKEMVDDVRKMLKAKGLDRKQIVYEKYD